MFFKKRQQFKSISPEKEMEYIKLMVEKPPRLWDKYALQVSHASGVIIKEHGNDRVSVEFKSGKRWVVDGFSEYFERVE